MELTCFNIAHYIYNLW